MSLLYQNNADCQGRISSLTDFTHAVGEAPTAAREGPYAPKNPKIQSGTRAETQEGAEMQMDYDYLMGAEFLQRAVAMQSDFSYTNHVPAKQTSGTLTL
jgi:hypothetical protein